MLFSLILLLTVVSSTGHYHDLGEIEHSECAICLSTIGTKYKTTEDESALTKAISSEYVRNSYEYIALSIKLNRLRQLKARAPPKSLFL